MPLQKRLIEVPIAKGLGQKVDPRILQVGSATTLSQLVQDKIGAWSKRPGTVDLGVASASKYGNAIAPASGGNISARLVPNPVGGIAQVNGYRLWSRSPLSSNDTKAYDLDDVTSILSQRYGVEVGPKAFGCFDIATNGTRILVVWLSPQASTQQPFYCVLDATTLQTIVPPQADTGSGTYAPGPTTNWMRLASMPDGLQDTVALVSQIGNTLYGALFTFSTLSWVTNTQLVTDCGKITAAGVTYGIYSCSMIDTATMALAYGTTANPPVVKAISFAVSGWAQNAAQSVTPPAATGLNIYGVAVEAPAGGHTYVAYSVSGGSTNAQRAFAVHTSNFTTLDIVDTALWTESSTIPYRLGIIGSPAGISGCLVVGSANNNSLNASTLNWIRFDVGPTVGTLSSRYGLGLSARPTVVTGKNVALVCYAERDPSFNSVTVQRTYYVVELRITGAPGSDAMPLSTIAPRIVSTGGQASLNIPNSIALSVFTSDERFITVGCTIKSAAGGYGVDLIDSRFTRALWQPARLGGVTYLSGGVPCAYDGERVTEIGMLYQPPSIGASVSSTTGGGVGPLSGSYTYTYSAVYEWRDKSGQRCQSRPTSATVAVSTNTSQIALTVPPLNLSLRQDRESNFQQQVAIAIYRDTATSPGNQVRIFSADVPATLLNTYQAASLTYTDVAADTDIAANESLYTSAAVDAVCPSSLSCLIVHNERLAGVGDDGVSIWMSTEYDGGSTQPYFNDANVITLGEGGGINALASMDGQLFALCRDTIFAIAGDGPQINGSGNTWGQPQKLAGGIGCSSDWRSVVSYKDGIVFQNGVKLYLLSRGLETSYFSGPIEDALAANPVVASSSHHATRNELRFCLKPTETATTGIVANYNYVTDTWSLFTYYDLDAAAFGADIDSSVVTGGVWYHASLNGRVWTEDASSNGYDVDSAATNHWIAYTAASAWVKADGFEAFKRFWDAMVTLHAVSPSDITISVGYNYADTFADVRTFTAAQIATFSTPQPQMVVHLTQQKGESVRMQITDAPPTGVSQTVGSGANILSMALLLGLKGGRIRLPATQGA